MAAIIRMTRVLNWIINFDTLFMLIVVFSVFSFCFYTFYTFVVFKSVYKSKKWVKIIISLIFLRSDTFDENFNQVIKVRGKFFKSILYEE